MDVVRRTGLVWAFGFCLLTSALGRSRPRRHHRARTRCSGRRRRRRRTEHKKILLVFSASWCGPCHMLEKFFDDPEVRPVLEKKLFVVVHLDVMENPKDQLHASNPGGELEMEKLGGGGTGVPYYAMLDAEGNWITDSKMPAGDEPPENLGYPSGSAEIGWFMHMVKKAAPEMAAEDVKTLRDFLEKHGSL